MFAPAARPASPSSAKKNAHNSPKHPHGVQGERRAKHQTQAAGAANTRHLLPEAKALMKIVGSIRPPTAARPLKEALRPSREPVEDFVTYSPFDLRFPPYASRPASRVSSPKASASSPLSSRVFVAKTLAAAAEKKAVAPKTKSATKSGKVVVDRRLRKEHKHHIPRKASNKKWHVAGWVTYSPFDKSFDRACHVATAPAAAHRPHAHHAAGRPHHAGHHQAHHAHHVAPAQQMIADYYAAQPNFVSFPRVSPMAVTGTVVPPPAGLTSFFMPSLRIPTTSNNSQALSSVNLSLSGSFPPQFAW